MIRLEDLEDMTTDRLRMSWEQDLGRPPPPHASDVYMCAVLAYRIQEKAGPKLSAAMERHLVKIAKTGDTEVDAARATRQLSEGASLVREWNGVTHEVRVLDKGFKFNGQRYRSLSAIAREITGTRWSGPVFFGLKPRGQKDAA